VFGEPVSFQDVLTWLDERLGQEVGVTVHGTCTNTSVGTTGILTTGPGERQLIDHRGGEVRDYVVGDVTRIQLCEDDLREAQLLVDEDGEALFLDLDHMKLNFGSAR
jgi:hypothetical protein